MEDLKTKMLKAIAPYCKPKVNAVDMLSAASACADVAEKEPRFKMPNDKDVVKVALIFNDGIIDEKKLTDMVAMCDFILARLYDNGDMSIMSNREKESDLNDNQNPTRKKK